MKKIIGESGITYTLADDGMYYPNLTLPEEEEPRYGKYGRMRKRYLQEHRKGVNAELLLAGKLVEHLNEVDDTANERMQLLIRQMAEKQHVDEALKAHDQLGWVGAINNIHHAAEEIVWNETLYIMAKAAGMKLMEMILKVTSPISNIFGLSEKMDNSRCGIVMNTAVAIIINTPENRIEHRSICSTHLCSLAPKLKLMISSMTC